MIVSTRSSTDVSKIQSFIDDGSVTQSFLPGISDDGFRMLSNIESAGVGVGSNLFGNMFGGGAAGGFLLYPNKSNLNQLQSVYSK